MQECFFIIWKVENQIPVTIQIYAGCKYVDSEVGRGGRDCAAWCQAQADTATGPQTRHPSWVAVSPPSTLKPRHLSQLSCRVVFNPFRNSIDFIGVVRFRNFYYSTYFLTIVIFVHSDRLKNCTRNDKI